MLLPKFVSHIAMR